MKIATMNNQEMTTAQNIGKMANQIHGLKAFDDYREGKSEHTIRRHQGDLALFGQYLGSNPAFENLDLYSNPEHWNVITWGLVKGFVKWMVNQSYALNSVNQRLSTIKVYSKLANQAGTLNEEENAKIAGLKGFKAREQKNVNSKRMSEGISSRIGHKKENWVVISKDQAKLLKYQPATPQGYRDSVLMGILLDHGLRCEELAILKVKDINLERNTMTFYRPKINETHTHELKNGTLKAIRKYLEIANLSKDDYLLSGSDRSGNLTTPGMSKQAITKRVKTLGQLIGLYGLSAHDCRHYYATQMIRNGTPMDVAMSAGGWKTPSMVIRYIEQNRIANAGVNLGDDD